MTIFYVKKARLGELTMFLPATGKYVPGLGPETSPSDFQTCDFSIMWTPPREKKKKQR